MKKSILLAAGLAIIALIVIAVIISNSNSPAAQNINSGANSNQPSDNNPSSTTSSGLESEESEPSAPQTPSASESETHNIEIVDFSFNPLTLTINQGDTIVWTNRDSAKHTVTSNSGSELGSELLGKDESYSHTFNTKGTFKYHCTPHPGMTGLVQVQ